MLKQAFELGSLPPSGYALPPPILSRSKRLGWQVQSSGRFGAAKGASPFSLRHSRHRAPFTAPRTETWLRPGRGLQNVRHMAHFPDFLAGDPFFRFFTLMLSSYRCGGTFPTSSTWTFEREASAFVFSGCSMDADSRPGSVSNSRGKNLFHPRRIAFSSHHAQFDPPPNNFCRRIEDPKEISFGGHRDHQPASSRPRLRGPP